MNPDIRKIKDRKEIPWDLLLLADPSREMIEKYLKNNPEIYLLLIDEKIIGVYVLVRLSSDAYELKNIALDEKYQGKGLGKRLVMDSIEKARKLDAKTIEVGTGNSSFSQLALYQKCGFKIIGFEKGFFTKNYPEEIIENGIKCTDMIRLSLDLQENGTMTSYREK